MTTEDQAETIAKSYLTPARKKGITREIQDLFDDLYQDMEYYAADYITGKAIERAEAFLEQVLRGDPNAAATLFEIRDSGRYQNVGYEAGKPWAQLIHHKPRRTSSQASRGPCRPSQQRAHQRPGVRC